MNIMMYMKYIIVSGGVVSGLGKGVTSSSIGAIFQSAGHTVTCIKIDPYLNVDAGTMSPFEHGECYVLDDGSETDLDLGNYERFIGISLTGKSSITTGKVYERVIANERRGDYLGKTVQIVPHVTDEIIRQIQETASIPVTFNNDRADVSDPNRFCYPAQFPEICIIELGGTVGDMEGLPFIEAMRILKYRTDNSSMSSQDDGDSEEISSDYDYSHPGTDFCFIHLALLPTVGGDCKTKPTQHSIQRLRSLGIQPDFLITRSDTPLDTPVIRKLSELCSIPTHNIIQNPKMASIYHVPLHFNTQNIYGKICAHLQISPRIPGTPCVEKFRKITSIIDRPVVPNERIYRVGIVGKYLGTADTYLSLVRAIEHAFYQLNTRFELNWIDAEGESLIEDLERTDGIIIPGGFGKRGIEGLVQAAHWARMLGKPCLGICLGFQVQVIEWTRACGHQDASSTEFDPHTTVPIIHIPVSSNTTNMGGISLVNAGYPCGTMRLGSQEVIIQPDSLAATVYGDTHTHERHRHRYEVNNALVDDLELIREGFSFTGISTQFDTSVPKMEILELDVRVHPFYMGCQFHPELKTRQEKPCPLFMGFAKTVCKGEII